MMKWFLLIALSVWSISNWATYFDRKNTETVEYVYQSDIKEVVIETPRAKSLTDNFWTWESVGRLKLIDRLLDDPQLTQARQKWGDQTISDLKKLALYTSNIQYESYDFASALQPAGVEIIPLRGDANGLYIPTESTLYLNSRVDWANVSFERFMEVVLHENMHHIMTHTITVMDESHYMRGDFEALFSAAFVHKKFGMAKDSHEVHQVNPQELVAYRTQRASRYAGIIDSDLSPEEMTARMQEIRVVRKKAGF